jgi:uncharacterized membrane protein
MFERSDTSPLSLAVTASDEIPLDDDETSSLAADDDAESSGVSTTLPVPADAAFEAFCDVASTPQWVSVVRSVHVQERTDSGRPRSASFLARLERGAIGYTMHYHYDEADRTVLWHTSPGGHTAVSGRVRFMPLGDRACLMEYELHIEMPGAALPPWEDPFFSGHAASVVMNDFRDFVIRTHRH